MKWYLNSSDFLFFWFSLVNYNRCNSLPRIGVCTWTSWLGKVCFFFLDLNWLTCHINSGGPLLFIVQRKMGANKTNPNRKKHGSSKTGIMFPSNPAECGRENPSKHNLGGKFLLHTVAFYVHPEVWRRCFSYFFIWVIHPHPSFRHETHPTSSNY